MENLHIVLLLLLLACLILCVTGKPATSSEPFQGDDCVIKNVIKVGQLDMFRTRLFIDTTGIKIGMRVTQGTVSSIVRAIWADSVMVDKNLNWQTGEASFCPMPTSINPAPSSGCMTRMVTSVGQNQELRTRLFMDVVTGVVPGMIVTQNNIRSLVRNVWTDSNSIIVDKNAGWTSGEISICPAPTLTPKPILNHVSENDVCLGTSKAVTRVGQNDFFRTRLFVDVTGVREGMRVIQGTTVGTVRNVWTDSVIVEKNRKWTTGEVTFCDPGSGCWYKTITNVGQRNVDRTRLFMDTRNLQPGMVITQGTLSTPILNVWSDSVIVEKNVNWVNGMVVICGP